MSKTAAFLVGCSFLALQVCLSLLPLIPLPFISLSPPPPSLYLQGASALGIINVNWSRLGRVARRRMGSVQRLAQSAGITSEQGDTTTVQVFATFLNSTSHSIIIVIYNLAETCGLLYIIHGFDLISLRTHNSSLEGAMEPEICNHSAPLEMLYPLVSLSDKVKIFRFLNFIFSSLPHHHLISSGCELLQTPHVHH